MQYRHYKWVGRRKSYNEDTLETFIASVLQLRDILTYKHR